MEDNKKYQPVDFYLVQMDENLFVIGQGKKPQKEDYIDQGNTALVPESYFINLRKWESSKVKYTCANVGDFLNLVLEGGYPLNEITEDLMQGILLDSEKIKIVDEVAFVIGKPLTTKNNIKMNRQQKIQQLQSLQQSLQLCTQPVDGHTDPLSINDCWNWMRELLEEIKDEDEKLLLRAEQFEKEEAYMAQGLEYHQHILVGIKRIVGVIKRHFGQTNI